MYCGGTQETFLHSKRTKTSTKSKLTQKSGNLVKGAGLKFMDLSYEALPMTFL